MPPKRARTARAPPAATTQSHAPLTKSKRATRATAPVNNSPSDEDATPEATKITRSDRIRNARSRSTDTDKSTATRNTGRGGRKGRGTRKDGDDAAQEHAEERLEAGNMATDVDLVSSPQIEQEATPVGTPASSRRSTRSKMLDTSLEPKKYEIPPATIQQMRTRVESTPLAGDTSVAALAHFRRRPRQHSLLHMVQNPDETFDTSELTLDTTLGSDVSPEFAPHDESTPQPQPRIQLPQPQFLAPDSVDEELYTVSPRPKHGRKRKSEEISGVDDEGDEIEVMRSQTPSRLPLSGSSSSLSEPRSSPSLPGPSASSNGSTTPRRIDIDSETYADPLSSSPATSPLPSPAKAKATESGRNEQKTVLTTAMLRALLPRRSSRHSKHSGDSSDEDDDDNDDGSEFMSARGARRATQKTTGRKVLGEVKGRRNAKVATTTARGKAKGAAKLKTKSTAANKENDDGASGETTSPLRNRSRRGTVTGNDKEGGSAKTYSRRTIVEVEDDEQSDEDEDEEGEQDDNGLSKELQAARDKFRRIDAGELEFESASLGSGSSPWR